MKKIIFILIVTIILLAILSFFLINKNINPTGKTISNTYSYTKAICNESNSCQDYIIKCEGNKTKERTPISGAVIEHDKNWKDPREKEQIEKTCG